MTGATDPEIAEIAIQRAKADRFNPVYDTERSLPMSEPLTNEQAVKAKYPNAYVISRDEGGHAITYDPDDLGVSQEQEDVEQSIAEAWADARRRLEPSIEANSVKRTWTCAWCGAVFLSSDEWAEHMKTHPEFEPVEAKKAVELAPLDEECERIIQRNLLTNAGSAWNDRAVRECRERQLIAALTRIRELEKKITALHTLLKTKVSGQAASAGSEDSGEGGL